MAYNNNVTYKELSDEMGFGIFKHKTIKDLLIDDESAYLTWMHNNTKNKIGKKLQKQILASDYNSDWIGDLK